MHGHNKRLGAQGEAHAAEHLEKEGYQIVRRNYRTPYAEIDLIARRADVLVFIEVKTRTSDAFGAPRLAVDARKQKKIAMAALLFLQETQDASSTIRFDVIECTKDGVTHLEDAFRCNEESGI